ncbi:MAG: ParM/StbA family protein [Colwellia sp.]
MEETNSEVKLSQIVANDDGSSYQKLSWFTFENGEITIKNSIMATKISEGMPNLSIGGSSSDCGLFTVNGQVFTCDEHTNGYDVRSRQDHQWSPGLIAMGQHALTKAGFGGQDVVLATGIPIQMFFSGEDGSPNQEIVTRKTNAFVNAEIKNQIDNKGTPNLVNENTLVSIVSNTVIPEAVGAYMDITINADGSDAEVFDEDVLIIDMGSYTTDIAVVGPHGRIRKEFVETLEDCGFLNIYDKFRKAAGEAGIRYGNIPNSRIEAALKTRELKVTNGSIDVGEVIDKVVEEAITPIVDRIKILIGDNINFLSAIVGVGGGAEFIKKYFGELSDVIIIPKDAQFSNSRGFLKTVTYRAGKDVVNDLS